MLFHSTLSTIETSSVTMELLLFTLHLLSFAGGLKLTNMTVPLVADTRSPMELNCNYNMEGEDMYAVKWYKDDNEFFRYGPHLQPPKQDFPVAGVHLRKENADCNLHHCRLILTGLSRPHSSGTYRCEVSTEAPYFRLASETKNITVATLPESDPRIEGLQESYVDGEIIRANCTSAPSDPTPILTWYIDHQQEATSFTKNDVPSDPDEDGLVSRSALLVMRATPKQEETIELSCEAALPGVPLAPRQTVRRVIVRKQQSESVNNEKLHWFNSSAAGTSPSAVCLFLMFIKKWWQV